MNADAIIRAQNEWFEEQVKKHLPSVAALYKMGLVAEAVQQIKDLCAARVYRQGLPYWLGLNIRGETVAFKDFSPRQDFNEDCFPVPHRLVQIQRQLEESHYEPPPQSYRPAAIDHVDEMIRNIDRDERKCRQRRLGEYFVKYGINPSDTPAY